jgi:hypothetical protein
MSGVLEFCGSVGMVESGFSFCPSIVGGDGGDGRVDSGFASFFCPLIGIGGELEFSETVPPELPLFRVVVGEAMIVSFVAGYQEMQLNVTG